MDIALTSILGVASGAGMILLIQEARREGREIQEMENSRVVSPHKLATLLENPDFLSTASTNPENPDEYIIKAFVEGRVRCSNPTKGSIEGTNSELVYRMYHKEDLYSNELLETKKAVDPKKLKYNSRNTQVRAPLEFNLIDEQNKASCTVHRSLEVDASDVLVKVGERREIKTLTWTDQVLIFIGVVAEAVRSILSKSSGTVFKGLRIGFTEREFGVRVNSAMTVFGDVVYNSKDKTLRIDSPLYYLQNKLHGLRLARHKIGTSYVLAVFSGIAFAACGYYLGKRAIEYYNAEQKKKLEKKKDKLTTTKFITLDGYKCMLCQTQPRNVVLKPCLHFLLCKPCLKQMKKGLCPVCDKTIEEAVDIFFS